MLTYIVDDNTVCRKYTAEQYKIPMHSANAIEVLFEFDETWEGCTTTCQLTKGDATYNLLVGVDNKVFIPSDITEGFWYVSVFGVKGTQSRNTSISAGLDVVKGGFVKGGVPPVPPTPDLYQQLIQTVKTSETNAKTSEVAAAKSLQDVNVASTAAISKMETYGDTRYANALIGNKSGTLVNVEDAWGADAVECRVEGKSAQIATVGKNLCHIPYTGRTDSGVTFSANSDGSIRVSGTATANAFSTNAITAFSNGFWLAAGTYTLSGGLSNSAYVYLKRFKEDGTADSPALTESRSAPTTFTLAARTYVGLTVLVAAGATINTTIKPQVEVGASATAWEPYSGGKPSPSPDYPQEVDVVDGPVVVEACGKNLSGYPYTTFAAPGTKVVNGVTFEAMPDGTIVANGTATANADIELKWVGIQTRLYGLDAVVSGCPSGGADDKYSIGIYAYRTGAFTNPVFNRDYGQGVVLTGMEYVRTYLRVVAGTTVSNLVFKPQIELGSTATPFEPYAVTKQTITLPPDHNYLASLPDGTRDTLAMRSDGVAVLTVATKQEVLDASIPAGSLATGVHKNGQQFAAFYRTGLLKMVNPLSNRYATSAYSQANSRIYIPSPNGFTINDSRFTSKQAALDVFATQPAVVVYAIKLPHVMYSADNGTTWSTADPAAGTSAIQLYKGTNNVWCADALSPNTNLEYVQDANAVIKKLSAAIVAAGSTGV